MNEELEAIKEFEEFEKEQKEYEIRQNLRNEQKERENRIKQREIKERKMIFKKFAPIVLGGVILASTALYIGSNENIKQLKAAKQLETEISNHGGYKIKVEGEYVYVNNLKKHVAENCKLDSNGTMEERIQNYCTQNNLSDEICDLAIQKYNCYYQNDFEDGDLIDLAKTVRQEQKEEKENSAYGMNQ